MNKGKKIAIALLFDMALLVGIVFAVSAIIHGSDSAWKINLSKAVIVLFIPCMFFMTYMSAAGDKYDTLPDELLDEEEDLSDTGNDTEQAENLHVDANQRASNFDDK